MDTIFPAHMTVSPDHTAQLFWDDAFLDRAGWVVRYWTADGTEHVVVAEADKDDGLEQLAEAAIFALDGLDLRGTLTIDVNRGDRKVGDIKISTQSGISWRYA